MPHFPPQQLTHTLQSLTPTEMLATIDFLQQRLQQSSQQIQNDAAIHHQLQKTQQALQVSEDKFRAIFDSTFQFIGLLDVNGVILEANQTALDAVGVGRSQVVGVPFWEAIWWTHSPALQAQLKQGIQRATTGELVRFEAQHILADGTALYVDFSLKPITDQDGKVVLLIPEGRDITERRAMEVALRKTLRSLEFQKLALDKAAIVAMTDSQGIITEVNDQFCQISQYSRAEVIGQTHRLINSGFHPQEFFQQLWGAIAAGQVWKGEIKNRAKDGSYYWVDTTIVPFLDDDSKPFQYLAIRFDITAHKIAQDKIREQAALLDVTTDAILVRDLEQKIEFWSQGAEKIYGWSAAEAIAKNAKDLIFQDTTLEEAQNALRMVLLRGEWQGELPKVTKQGRRIIVASRWTLVRDNDGKPKAILSVDTDITERRSLEQQFLRTQRLENLGTLASGIAHDLNNVFTPIIAAAQLLPHTLPNLSPRSIRILDLLESSSKRGSNLIKQILSFARGMDGQRTTVQVGHLLLEIANISRQTFPKNIRTEVDIPTNILWTVEADPTQMQQVFMNLAVNARDAMPEGGTLSICAENIEVDAHLAATCQYLREGSFLRVAIADTGVGMSPEIIEQIFDPFFSTKPKDQGTGLGLSTAFGIVKNHGGFIQVSSEIGRGSEFQVYLPVLNGDRPAESELYQADHIHTLTGKGELILIVDDEVSIQEITKLSLEAFNYQTLAASDGIEAIATYAEHRNEIKVVLLDCMMPLMNSPTLISTLKRLNPDVQILLMSGSDDDDQAAMVAEVIAFLPKPFTAEALLEALHDLLQPHT